MLKTKLTLSIVALTVLFTTGCGSKNPMGKMTEYKFNGVLETSGSDALSQGLVSGQYQFRFTGDGNKTIQFQSVGGAERVLSVSKTLTDADLGKIKFEKGEEDDEFPQAGSITLDGRSIGQSFNMGISITKLVKRTSKYTEKENCTIAFCDDDEDDCDGTRKVTYRQDYGVYKLRVVFTRFGLERDTTPLANFTADSSAWENTYELSRTKCKN